MIEHECHRVFKNDDVEIVKSYDDVLYYIADSKVFVINPIMKSAEATVKLIEY